MKPINLFLQSRIEDKKCFDIMAKHSLGIAESETRIHEIKSLRLFVDKLGEHGVQIGALDGFFMGYKIQQIGKEFDLLKITEDELLNIELKSQKILPEEICSQLVRNKYYLSHLGKNAKFYTVNTENFTVYTIGEENNLCEIEFGTVVEQINFFAKHDYLTEIDKLFRVSDYLISPLNTPEKFIRGEYFLTNQQEEIKSCVLRKVQEIGSGFFSIIGTPGTGKTLLLYDIAKELTKKGKVVVIHCGKLADGQIYLNKNLQNFNVSSIVSMRYDDSLLNEYDFVLVDESHRIFPYQFDMICSFVRENNKVCIFSSDPGQTLSIQERERKIVEKILALPLIAKYELSEKIRTNKELASFIKKVRNLKKSVPVSVSYENISLAYAKSVTEARKIIKYFRANGYVFINYSKSNCCHSPYEKYYEEDYDTHHVIGQEFDNVLLLMDNSFYYDEDGVLQGITHPNPDYLYPNLFYQGITRVREKIAIVVVEAPILFQQISSIFDRG